MANFENKDLAAERAERKLSSAQYELRAARSAVESAQKSVNRCNKKVGFSDETIARLENMIEKSEGREAAQQEGAKQEELEQAKDKIAEMKEKLVDAKARKIVRLGDLEDSQAKLVRVTNELNEKAPALEEKITELTEKLPPTEMEQGPLLTNVEATPVVPEVDATSGVEGATSVAEGQASQADVDSDLDTPIDNVDVDLAVEGAEQIAAVQTAQQKSDEDARITAEQEVELDEQQKRNEAAQAEAGQENAVNVPTPEAVTTDEPVTQESPEEKEARAELGKLGAEAGGKDFKSKDYLQTEETKRKPTIASRVAAGMQSMKDNSRVPFLRGQSTIDRDEIAKLNNQLVKGEKNLGNKGGGDKYPAEIAAERLEREAKTAKMKVIGQKINTISELKGLETERKAAQGDLSEVRATLDELAKIEDPDQVKEAKETVKALEKQARRLTREIKEIEKEGGKAAQDLKGFEKQLPKLQNKIDKASVKKEAISAQVTQMKAIGQSKDNAEARIGGRVDAVAETKVGHSRAADNIAKTVKGTSIEGDRNNVEQAKQGAKEASKAAGTVLTGFGGRVSQANVTGKKTLSDRMIAVAEGAQSLGKVVSINSAAKNTAMMDQALKGAGIDLKDIKMENGGEAINTNASVVAANQARPAKENTSQAR